MKFNNKPMQNSTYVIFVKNIDDSLEVVGKLENDLSHANLSQIDSLLKVAKDLKSEGGIFKGYFNSGNNPFLLVSVSDNIDVKSLRNTISTVVNATKKDDSIYLFMSGLFDEEFYNYGYAFANQLVYSSYEYTRFKDVKVSLTNISCDIDNDEWNNGVDNGSKVGIAQNYAKDLLNDPPNICGSDYLRDQAL